MDDENKMLIVFIILAVLLIIILVILVVVVSISCLNLVTAIVSKLFNNFYTCFRLFVVRFSVMLVRYVLAVLCNKEVLL